MADFPSSDVRHGSSQPHIKIPAVGRRSGVAASAALRSSAAPERMPTQSRPTPFAVADRHAVEQASAQVDAIADGPTRQRVRDALRGAETFLQGAEDRGWWTASMLLRHFLAGSGRPVTVPASLLADFGSAGPAAKRVLSHFDDWLLGRPGFKDSEVGFPTIGLRNGERVVVGGAEGIPGDQLGARVMWESVFPGAGFFNADHLSDAQASIGGGTMRGYGRFVIERHADVVTIAGFVDLRAEDAYTFDSGDIFNPGFRHLEPAGIGHSFDVMTTFWRVPYFAQVRLGRGGQPVSLVSQTGDPAIPTVLR